MNSMETHDFNFLKLKNEQIILGQQIIDFLSVRSLEKNATGLPYFEESIILCSQNVDFKEYDFSVFTNTLQYFLLKLQDSWINGIAYLIPVINCKAFNSITVCPLLGMTSLIPSPSRFWLMKTKQMKYPCTQQSTMTPRSSFPFVINNIVKCFGSFHCFVFLKQWIRIMWYVANIFQSNS